MLAVSLQWGFVTVRQKIKAGVAKDEGPQTTHQASLIEFLKHVCVSPSTPHLYVYPPSTVCLHIPIQLFFSFHSFT